MKSSNHRLGRSAALLVSALGASVLLSACAPLLLGGAAVGSAMVVTDRRSTGTQLDDQGIELKAVNRIAPIAGDRGHVSATSYNKVVLLSGEVPDEAMRARVEQQVRSIEGVRSVVNELAILAPSSLTARSNDSLLTSKVKATLVDAKDIQASAIKVVTERGTVYLMGVVTEREATRASDLARSVSGVQKVVRVFEVITEAQLANTKPAPVVEK
ncbi:BON domain-containing protein [Aquincola tertiaricarbonis]|uniref:BON domain-containing protein n=1 Tax=Aquincola tertiaricarbonis TaxID=391953 RepID=A0ABY4SFP2_AQUTE|nr:BON domain-containing protein [Aquincola tertiaricarbonis]URI10115.1 BON domain-containing protein [Aquincola tertiaricarbonis]